MHHSHISHIRLHLLHRLNLWRGQNDIFTYSSTWTTANNIYYIYYIFQNRKKILDEVALGRETILKTVDYRKIKESNGYRQFSEKFIKNVHVENSLKVLCSTFFVKEQKLGYLIKCSAQIHCRSQHCFNLRINSKLHGTSY